MAIGLALSPLPLLALMIILMTHRARQNSIGFLAGWILGILLIAAIVYFIPALVSTESEPSRNSGWARVGFGVILLLGAIQQYQKRTRKGQNPVIPKAMEKLATVGILQSVLAGFLMSSVNIKNAMFIGAGTAEILASQVTDMTRVTAFVQFVLIGSCSFMLPIIILFVFQSRSKVVLSRFRVWLSRNVHLVLAILLLAISLLLFMQAGMILF